MENSLKAIQDKAAEYRETHLKLEQLGKDADKLIREAMELRRKLSDGDVVKIYLHGKKLDILGVVNGVHCFVSKNHHFRDGGTITEDNLQIKYIIHPVLKNGEMGVFHYPDRRVMPLKGTEDSYDDYYIVPTGVNISKRK